MAAAATTLWSLQKLLHHTHPHHPLTITTTTIITTITGLLSMLQAPQVLLNLLYHLHPVEELKMHLHIALHPASAKATSHPLNHAVKEAVTNPLLEMRRMQLDITAIKMTKLHKFFPYPQPATVEIL
jgi:hypothetical protein